MRSKLTFGCIGLAAAAAAWFGAQSPWQPALSAPPFRIGYNHSPPTAYREDCKPQGYAVDLISEACRRRRILETV